MMNRTFVVSGSVVCLALLLSPAAGAFNAAAKTCPKSEAVLVGATCVDTFEASVWSPPADPQARKKFGKLVRKGKATLAKLTALGATQRGATSDNYPCNDNGNDCKDRIFAVSIPGVLPSAYITWFQAQQACGNSGKRLLTNAEWQMAAAGTPDPGDADNGSTACATNSSLSNTGSRSNCVSAWGAHDMVGNVWEWVADWMQDNSDADDGAYSSATFGNDAILGVDEAYPFTDRFPGALLRGGHFGYGAAAGLFALAANNGPSSSFDWAGFRCGR